MKVDLISRLSKARSTGRGTWVACCPAHEDKSPSMTVRECDDGRWLIHCFAGCEPLAILDAIGMGFDDLFPEPIERGVPLRRPFPAADVLECLSMESKVVLVVGRRSTEGLPITEADMARLAVALGRIEEGRSLANG
jgi:hypothetical protein